MLSSSPSSRSVTLMASSFSEHNIRVLQKQARQLDAHQLTASSLNAASSLNEDVVSGSSRNISWYAWPNLWVCSTKQCLTYQGSSSRSRSRIHQVVEAYDIDHRSPHRSRLAMPWVSSGTRYLFDRDKTQPPPQCNHYLEVSESAFLKNWGHWQAPPGPASSADLKEVFWSQLTDGHQNGYGNSLFLVWKVNTIQTQRFLV